MKMNTPLFRIAVATLLALCFCGCDEDKMILELKDVQNFQAVEKQATSELQISGLAFHSAFGVKKITIEKQDHDLVIKLYLVRAGEKYSGSFNYTVAVPADTARVLFGKDRKEIWKRP